MLRLSLRNIGAHKRRLVGTALSVIIGIAFLAGTFVFTDTIRRSFDDLFADVYDDTDALVRSASEIDAGFAGTQRSRIPEETVEAVRAIPGVADAIPDLTGFARIIDADGDALGGQGPPTFGGSIVDSDLLPWQLDEGRYPDGSTEMMMDAWSFDSGDFALGDQVRVESQGGARDFTLVGVVRFGEADSPGGATFALFDVATAEEFIAQPGQVDAILVRGEGQTQEELAQLVRTGLGDDTLEVVTGDQITEESQDDVQAGLSFFNNILLVFAGISLFVSAFIIYNTFSIIVAQRQRETALLRAIGASRKQVVGSVLIESVAIGLVASALGLLAGIALSELMRSGLGAIGVDIPSAGLVLLPRTIVVSLVVGLVITTVAAVSPAVAASRIPPIAAMRDVAVEDVSFSRRRFLAGMLLLVVGAVLVALGLGGEIAALGLGIPLVFVALFVLGPLIARPVARVIGAPLPRARGITGTLARENAMRNPKRTARTAAALLVGVALVSGISVLASSVRSSIREIIGEQFTGDFVVASSTFGFGGLAPELALRLDELPEVAAATGVQLGFGTIGDDVEALSVIDPATANAVFDLGVVAGSVEGLTDAGILLSMDAADDQGVGLGDTLTLTLLDGTPRELEVQGIYDSEDLAGPYSISKGLFALSGADQFDFSVFVQLAAGVSEDDGRAAMAPITDEYASADLQSRQEYIDASAASIDGFVNLIYGLLGLAVIIALVGVANTLSLSVYERTRELGLIRAVGGSRRQVRSSIRWESVITALLGAVQGIIIGIVLGYVVIVALRDEGLRSFSVSVPTLVVIVVVAILGAILAAIRPARRAARLDVLDAISHD